MCYLGNLFSRWGKFEDLIRFKNAHRCWIKPQTCNSLCNLCAALERPQPLTENHILSETVMIASQHLSLEIEDFFFFTHNQTIKLNAIR